MTEGSSIFITGFFNIVRSILLFSCFYYVLPVRKNKTFRISALIFCILLVIFSLLQNTYSRSDVVFFISQIILILFAFEGTKKKKVNALTFLLFVELLAHVFILFLDIGEYRAQPLDIKASVWRQLVLSLIVNQVFLFGVFSFYITEYKVRHAIHERISTWIFLIAEIFCYVIALYILFRCMILNIKTSFYLALLLLLINIVMILIMVLYYFLIIYTLKYQRQITGALIKSKNEQKEAEIEAAYRELAELRHDLKNQFLVIENLVNHGESEPSTDDYVKNLKKRLMPVYSIGCTSVDAALTVKSRLYLNEGIELHMELCPLDHLCVKEQELTSVIMNLLDNAYEAVRSENVRKEVYFEMRRMKKMLFITCINETAKVKLLSENQLIIKHSQGHGYGLDIIKSTVSRCGGTSSIFIRNSMFTVKIALPAFELAESDLLNEDQESCCFSVENG